MVSIQPKDWENPQVVGRNKQPAHVTLLSHADLSKVLSGERELSPYCWFLNGDWQFNFDPAPVAAPEDFYYPEFELLRVRCYPSLRYLTDPRKWHSKLCKP